MSYTLSMDASVKVQRGRIVGLFRHNGRDVDRRQGREVRHSNPDIDALRTDKNRTMVRDEKGGWKICQDLKEIEVALDTRLSDVKKPLRKDAVVLRPLILQLDPKWYEGHTDPKERALADGYMMGWARDTFGEENLIYVAVHDDEHGHHLHVGFCPVTADGRLSQKDWFPCPTALHQMHQDFRQTMRDAGYDVDMTNQKPGKHARRMSVKEYKDFKDLQNERMALEAREKALEAREAQVRVEAEAVETARQAVSERAREVSAAEAAVKTREDAVKAREAVLDERERAIARKERLSDTKAWELYDEMGSRGVRIRGEREM